MPRPRRYRDVGVSRPSRDRDIGVTVSRRDRDVRKTPRDRFETETFEIETTTLLYSITITFTTENQLKILSKHNVVKRN